MGTWADPPLLANDARNGALAIESIASAERILPGRMDDDIVSLRLEIKTGLPKEASIQTLYRSENEFRAEL
jgi:hypothetical protein